MGFVNPRQPLRYKTGADDEGAGGVRQPSSNTSGCPPADDEGADEGAEGPRRNIFDLENISQHEKAVAAIVR